ncbi:hypothetical protein [Moorena sp. SIO4G3]|nr:hypothetical protein [Moorena sp. SIO4G3]
MRYTRLVSLHPLPAPGLRTPHTLNPTLLTLLPTPINSGRSTSPN